jgi:hypothetical protein
MNNLLLYVCVFKHSYKDSGNDIHKNQKLPEVDMVLKRKTLQWKNTKNYYEVKLAESSMFAF